MKEYSIGINEAGQRFDKYLAKLLPAAPKSFIYKMLRKKNIVLNGKKSEGNEITAKGDVVKLFLADATIDEFQTSAKKKVSTNTNIPKAEVLYEDEHVLMLNKPAGILSQRAEKNDISMVEVVISYLTETKAISDEQLKTFQPSVINRLDRNTSGIILAGKSLPGAQELSEAMRDRSFRKEYLCIVKGLVKEAIMLDGYLVKDEKTNKVYISKKSTDDGDRIYTDIKPLAYGESCTLMLIHLITGKPHQIRAHMASIGHPIFGDSKYGDSRLNRSLNDKYKLKYQLLHSWRVTFEKTDGALIGLKNKTITAPLPRLFDKVLKGENIIWQPGQDEA